MTEEFTLSLTEGPEETGSDLFGSIESPVMSATEISRTAAMSSIVDSKNGLEPDFQRSLSVLQDPNEAQRVQTEVAEQRLATFEADRQALLAGTISDPEGDMEDYFALYDMSLDDKQKNAVRQTAMALEVTEAAGLNAAQSTEGYLRLLESDDEVEDLKDLNTFKDIVFSELSGIIKEKSEEQSLLGDVVDFAKNLVVPDAWYWSDIEDMTIAPMMGDSKEEWIDGLRYGTVAEITTRIGNTYEVIKEIANDNPSMAASMLSDMQNYVGQGIDNVFGVLTVVDAATIGLTSGLKAVKAGKALRAASIARNHGARKGATEMEEALVDLARESTDGDLEDEAISSVLPRVFADDVDDVTVGGEGELLQTLLERHEEGIQLVDDVIQGTRLDFAEEAKAITKEKARINTRLSHLFEEGTDDSVKIFSVQSAEEAVDNITRVHLDIGQGSNRMQGFIDEDAARGWAENMGLHNREYLIVEKPEGMYLRFTSTVDERGVVEPLKLENIRSKTFGAGRIFWSSKKLGTEEVAAYGQLGHNQRALIEREFQKSIDTIDKLIGKDHDTFVGWAEHLQSVDNGNGKWLSMSEMDTYWNKKLGRDATLKEKEAYGELIRANDLDYHIKDTFLRKSLASTGHREFLLRGVDGTPRIIGQDVQKVKNAEGVSLLDLTNPQDQLWTRGRSKQVRMDELTENPDVAVIRVRNQFDVPGVEQKDWDYIAVPRALLGEKQVGRNLLSYKAGGRRAYTGEYFIKQANVGSKSKYRDTTHFVFDNPEEAKAFTGKLEELRQMAKEVTKDGVTDIAKRKAAVSFIQANFPEWGDPLELIGKLKTDTPFEMVYTGGKTQHGSSLLNVEDVDDLSDEALGLIQNTGFSFERKRGEMLKHPQRAATMVDPLKMVGKAMNEASKIGALSDFKVRQVNKFMKTYGHTLDVQEGSDFFRFSKGTPQRSEFPTAEEYNAAMSQRMALRNVLQEATPDEIMAQNFKKSAFEFLVKKHPKIANGLKAFTEMEPVVALKSATFNLFLGFGDISQLFVQTGMLPVMAMTHPKLAPKAFAMSTMYWLSRQNGHKSIEHLATKVAPKLGLEPDEFRNFYEMTRKSGVELVEATQADLATLGHNHVRKGSVAANTIHYGGKGLKAGRYFFDEAERYNKLSTYALAFLQNGAKKFDNSLEAAKVARTAEAYAGNMTTSSRAAWQRGGMGLLTQFQAHPWRVAELIFTDGAGFDPSTRKKFAGALALTYGSGAYVGDLFEYGEEAWVGIFGEEMPQEAKAFLRDGLFGGLGQFAFGDERPSAERLRTFSRTVIHDILAGKSIGDMVPAIGAMENVGGAFSAAYYTRAVATGNVGEALEVADGYKFLEGLARVPSGINRAWTAADILLTGQWIQRKGKLQGQVVTDIDDTVQAALSTLFFGKPVSIEDVLTDTYKVTKTKKYLQEKASQISLELNKALDPNISDVEREEILKRVEVMRNVYGTSLSTLGSDEFQSYHLDQMLTKTFTKNKDSMADRLMLNNYKFYGRIGTNYEDGE